MQQVLIVIHPLVVIALVTVILLQRLVSDALGGFGGGAAVGFSGLMTGHGQANVLTCTIAMSLLPAILSGNIFFGFDPATEGRRRNGIG